MVCVTVRARVDSACRLAGIARRSLRGGMSRRQSLRPSGVDDIIRVGASPGRITHDTVRP
jgi:hypothetical protein